MNVEEIMSRPAITCRSNDSLSTPAQLMWEHDCGAIPVTDEEGRLVGVITDRDICMATYTRGSAPASIPVADAMAREVFSSRVSDSLQTIEQLMGDKQIRRVPVVDGDNRPIGMVSVNDLARYAASPQQNDGEDRELARMLASICAPRTQSSQQSGMLQRTAAE